ncbi:kelch repeat-containing protein [Paenibacillus sp. 1P07SE]|uniref:Kelch repeat-containing protein n=1 Tax=Paenibacillus sp. 1P07SE TaxID=3132209 RepID=UPI0039A65340
MESQFRANLVSPRNVSYSGKLTATTFPSPWVQAESTPSPSARDSSAAVYDPDSSRVILFGGSGDNGQLNDLWVWDGHSWEDLTPDPLPASWPSARSSACIVYDSSEQRVLLFGGADTDGNRNDLWVWEAGEQAWYNVTPDPLPASWPSARSEAGLVEVQAAGGFLLFGGSGSGDPLQDLWLLESGMFEWTNVTPSTLPGEWPSGRTGHLFTALGPSSEVLLFGGYNNCGALGDTWLLNASGGQYAWSLQETPLHLTPRFSSSAAYDSANGRIVLFGGIDGNYLNDTWTWSSSTGWSSFTPPAPYDWSQPNIRCASVMAYNAQSMQLVLFGGVFGTLAFSAELGDTWTWTVAAK